MDRKHCPRNYTVKGKESLEKKKELKSLRISEEIKLQKFYLYTFVTLTDGYNFCPQAEPWLFIGVIKFFFFFFF